MTEWIAEHAANPWLVFFGLILLSFILEDLATLTGAALFAEGTASLAVALSAVLVGIIVGDLGLYMAGRIARHNRALRNWLGRRGLFDAKPWFHGNLAWLVLLARFTPGLRLPTYSACGLVGISFLRFSLFAVLFVVIWTVALFALAATLADFAERYLALKDSWLVIVPVLLAALWFGQRAIRKRVKRSRDNAVNSELAADPAAAETNHQN